MTTLNLYINVAMEWRVPIAFAGIEASAADGELISVGSIGSRVNRELSPAIADILQIKLCINSSRFHIKFYDVQRSFLGFKRLNFLTSFDSWTVLHHGWLYLLA